MDTQVGTPENLMQAIENGCESTALHNPFTVVEYEIIFDHVKDKLNQIFTVAIGEAYLDRDFQGEKRLKDVYFQMTGKRINDGKK